MKIKLNSRNMAVLFTAIDFADEMAGGKDPELIDYYRDMFIKLRVDIADQVSPKIRKNIQRQLQGL